MNAGSYSLHQRAPGESTEWEDIQRRLGNMPSVEDAKATIEAAVEAELERVEAAEAARPQRELDDRAVEDLDELEEEGGAYEDSRALAEYRRKRLEQMRSKQAQAKFGDVQALARADFVREVTEASHEQWVVVFLFDEASQSSRLLEPVIRELAARHKAVKFLRIRGTDCIEGYPLENIPTLLCYHEGQAQRQIIGLTMLGGSDVCADNVEWVLSRLGAVETELEEDPRSTAGASAAGGGGRAGSTFVRYVVDDE